MRNPSVRKFSRALAWAVCEALFILEIPMPTAYLREEWGHWGWWWCTHVHSDLEQPYPGAAP